jgi:S-formylglutathione hydrolase
MALETLNQWKCFGGTQSVYAHDSKATGTRMEFAVFEPAKTSDAPRPILYWLSGLTCNWENFVTKAGAQRYAAAHNMVIVCPDTSPRGDAVPDAADEYDFGKGAGFYVNATQQPWSKNYHMYDYVVTELPEVIEPNLSTPVSARGISGHSMGGHGALTLALKNPDHYTSVSAFSPIVAPSQVPWGEKALGRYLGDDRAVWAAHDACALIAKHGWSADILVDQGEADNFLEEQLRPQLLVEACRDANVPLDLRLRPGYDHSYYFVSSFIGDHIAWHAKRLAS